LKTMNKNHSQAILLCPTGQDAKLIAAVLKKESVDSRSLRSINELCDLHHDEAGVIIIAEEALTIDGIESLNKYLLAQKTWSDIPIILLVGSGVRNKEFKLKRLEVFVSSGNVTLLERPLQPLTLLSAAQVLLRSRKRQYQVRDLLKSQTQATSIRDEFISIASHELKTPLTSLKLQTQMTRRQISRPEAMTSEKMKKQLDYTVHQIDRLDKLVDDMLDISRINTGKLIIHKAKFNLSELLCELIERFTPQFEAAGCTIKTNIEPNVIGDWDTYKIEQVINNLFSNAIRYSPKKMITVGLKIVDTNAVMNVKDKGIGIESDNLERIFERFERVSSTVSGLGLGLYITRQILDLHNGSIKAESEIGKGSNFIIHLPLQS